MRNTGLSSVITGNHWDGSSILLSIFYLQYFKILDIESTSLAIKFLRRMGCGSHLLYYTIILCGRLCRVIGTYSWNIQNPDAPSMSRRKNSYLDSMIEIAQHDYPE